MGRPKNEILKKTINMKIDLKIVDLLKEVSKQTGIPQNRLVENAVRNTYSKNKTEKIKNDHKN